MSEYLVTLDSVYYRIDANSPLQAAIRVIATDLAESLDENYINRETYDREINYLNQAESVEDLWHTGYDFDVIAEDEIVELL